MKSTATLKQSRWKPVALWIVRGLLAIVFVGAGAAKLYGAPEMVQAFAQIGFGQWFRYLTGAIEIVGAIALLFPSAVVLGAVLILGVSAGAFFVQALIMHGDVIHTVVLGALAATLLWSRRDQVVRALGSR